LLTCLALCALVPGCGERTITVKGRVMHHGKPLDLGALPKDGKGAATFPPTVIFLPATDPQQGEGKRYQATLDLATGAYEVRLPPGRYRVSVFVPGLSATTPAPPDTVNAPARVYDLSAGRSLDLPVERQ
jgi:hypothetical protein